MPIAFNRQAHRGDRPLLQDLQETQKPGTQLQPGLVHSSVVGTSQAAGLQRFAAAGLHGLTTINLIYYI